MSWNDAVAPVVRLLQQYHENLSMSNLLMSLKFRKNLLSQVVEVTNDQSKTDDDEVKQTKHSSFWWGRRLVMAASLLLPCFALLLLCVTIMRPLAPSKVSPRL